MKSEELLYSMEHVGSDLLAAAEQTVLVRKHTSWGKTAAAAVLALAVGVGGFLLLKNLHANDDPVPATNPSDIHASSTEATETQEPDTVIDPLSLVGESLSESGSYTDGVGNQWDYSYELPCINADTTGAKAINEEIEQVYGKLVREAHEDMEQNCSLIWISIDYDATAWNNILSVKVHSSGNVGGMEEYRIFNYDCSLGRWITTQELLDRMGISEEAFREACRIQFEENEYHEPDGSGIFFDDDEMIKKDGNYYRYRNKGTSDEKLAEVEVHPYQDGRVEVIAPISLGAGAAYYEIPFDLFAEHKPEITEAQDTDVQETEPQNTDAQETETKEQDADALRAELEALFRDEDCDNLNPYVRALTCYYESPALVDFRELFYCSLGLELYEDEATKEMLKSKYPAFFSNLYTDCDRLTEAEMDKVLRQVFGVGIDQTRKKNLDSFFYVPETDSYYHEHGDTNALGTSPLIQDVRTEEDGLVLFTYKIPEGFVGDGKFSNIRTVALKKENGVYHIVSHLPGEFPNPENLVLSNTAWRMEAEAGDEGPDVRELEVDAHFGISYREGEKDSEFYSFAFGNVTVSEDGSLWIELHETKEDGNRIGEDYEANFSCVQEDGTMVLTQLSDRGFHNDPKGTVLRFHPNTKD